MFLRLCWLLCTICHAWDLPIECTTPEHHHIKPTRGRESRDPDPRYRIMDTTIPPAIQWQVGCCNAIQTKYHANNNSPCGYLYDGDFNPLSCELNTDSKIKKIYVRNCSLSGSIPTEFKFMTDLRVLDLRDNALDGGIPSYFNQHRLFPNLQGLYLGNNNLDGTIPFNIFQYPQLFRMDMSCNTRLHLDISHLNLTSSLALSNKPAIYANFSFIHIDVDVDLSLYSFFDTLRFSKFSMRYSVNNLSFKWRNRKAIDSNEYHAIYATDLFDIDGNNMSGEFPCHFKSIPYEFYVANNAFSSWNMTCYKSKHFGTLMLFQKEHVYASMGNKCYHDYSGWSMSNDYYSYYEYCVSSRAPLALKKCCLNRSKPTQHPTGQAHTSNEPILQWFIDNVEWILLLLIIALLLCALVMYSFWKRNGKYRHLTLSESIDTNIIATPLKATSHKKSTLGEKSLLNGEESLLYGDF